MHRLACYRALAGDSAAALRHFRIAADADREVIEIAADDSDLDPIRDLPGYPG